MNAQTLRFPGAKTVDQATCLADLRQCVLEGERCLVVTGEPDSGLTTLVSELIRDVPCEHVVHVTAVTSEPQEFLQRVLSQLGFEPFAAGTSELLRLLSIFLQHEKAQGRRSLVAVEHVHRFGPRVLDLLQMLIGLDGPEGPPVTLLLTGRPDLGRVLDSPGMEAVAAQTEARWQLLPGDAESLPPQPMLLVSRDQGLLGHLSLTRPRTLVGRHRQNDLVLEGHYVSRHHAILTSGPGETLLVDLNSTNGTYVNGVAIKHHQLAHSDVIQIGGYRLKYVAPATQHRPSTLPERYDETREVPALADIGPAIQPGHAPQPGNLADTG